MTRPTLPMPADFPAKMLELKLAELAKHYGRDYAVVLRWADEAGRPKMSTAHPERPVPDDFAEHAATETNEQLIQRYRCGRKVLFRWRRETGIKAAPRGKGGTAPLPIPDGFALSAPVHTLKDLRINYGRSAATILKWCAQLGVSPRRAAPTRQRTTSRGVMASTKMFNPTAPAIRRDDSLAGRAADYLRRFGSVYRCDAQGNQLSDGFFWCRGGRFVLTDDEIIERALRNGFDPGAWERLVA